MNLGHFAQAVAILLVAGGCSWRYRRRLRLSDNRYLWFWLFACIVWFIWYLAKALRWVGPHATATDPTTAQAKVYVDLALNIVNSVFIAEAAYELWKRTKPGDHLDLLHVAYHVGGLLLAQFFLWLLLTVVNAPWMLFEGVVGSYMAGVVLILFYHRLSGHERVSSTQSGVVLMIFFSYAFLQGWYPYLFFKEHTRLVGLIYSSAAVLKIACTLIVFRFSQPVSELPPALAIAPVPCGPGIPTAASPQTGGASALA